MTERMIGPYIESLWHYENLVGRTALASLNQLEIDSKTNLFVISVLGEFKRGKSTLINALLGEDVLPRDVTPMTAAICIIRFSTERILKIHWANQEVETRELSDQALAEFTAAAGFDPDLLDYLEIGIDSDLLEEGIVLVDTPGVDDLNHHRSEVACRFVPRSDAVIFVLSATAPVRRTETEFLETSILEAGLDRILFVANFADLVDDDLGSVTERIARRLAPALGSRVPQIIPMSATEALRSSLSGHEVARSSSGLSDLTDAISELTTFSDRERIRQRRQFYRLKNIAKQFQSDIEQSLSLLEQDILALESELSGIQMTIASKGERKDRLDSWLEDRRAEILAMVRKSLQHFHDEVFDHIVETVEDYKAPDFKSFIEEKVPQRIKKFCKVWIEGHTGPMNSLLNQLDSRIVASLGAEFESHVPRLRNKGSIKIEGAVALGLQAEDVSRASQRAGLLAGGAAAVLLLLHASIFVPIIGMAALPFLSKGMTEQELKRAKEKLRPSLEQTLSVTLNEFSDRVLRAVSTDIDTLRQTAENQFDQLMVEMQERVSAALKDRTDESGKVQETTETLQAALDQIMKVASKIEVELEAIEQ